jgi:hypothetical protein
LQFENEFPKLNNPRIFFEAGDGVTFLKSLQKIRLVVLEIVNILVHTHQYRATLPTFTLGTKRLIGS